MSEIVVTLPDGSELDVESGSTVEDVAYEIGPGLGADTIAGVVDGEHWDGVDAFFAKYEGKAPGQKKAEVGAAVPYGRMGRAEDLTGMAVFLASDEAGYIVAQTYNVDGGNWMS